MIFNINSTRGQTQFLTCVARVTCPVQIKVHSGDNYNHNINDYFFQMKDMGAELPSR